eukprot:2310880-Amphidinium_carterae.1
MVGEESDRPPGCWTTHGYSDSCRRTLGERPGSGGDDGSCAIERRDGAASWPPGKFHWVEPVQHAHNTQHVGYSPNASGCPRGAASPRR